MIRIFIFLLLLAVGAVAVYLFSNRENKAVRGDLYEAFFKVIASNLRQNLKRLEAGDLGWRRLGHGQSTIGLKKVAPRKADVIPVSLDRVEEKYPGIVQEIRAIDTAIDRLQAAANRLSEVLEEPVRGRFQEDRRELPKRRDEQVLPFRKWLIDREDAWMEMLANLINSGQTLVETSDPGTLYWQLTRESYETILRDHGGEELEDMERLKTKITDQSRNLLDQLDDVVES